MKSCKNCHKFRYKIDDEGYCEPCAKERKGRNINLRFHDSGKQVIPYMASGKILSKERWLIIKRQVDAYYNSVSMDDIDLHNGAVDISKKMLSANTEPGYIYLLSSSVGYYKIGKTTNMDRRVNEHLRMYPVELIIEHVVFVSNITKSERHLLDCFSDKQMQGEWFQLDTDDVAWIKSLTSESLDALVGK